MTSRPSAGSGDEVVAFVVPQQPLEVAELRRHLLARLAPYKVPTHVEIVDEIARTASGKRSRLRPGTPVSDAVASEPPTQQASGERSSSVDVVGLSVAVVAPYLREVLDDHLSLWKLAEPEGEVIERAARRLVLEGGKRVRPALCYWAYVGTGGTSTDLIKRVAAALELIHAFALVHDDVMDRSATRRGAPTAYVLFAELHEEQQWRGSAEHYGQSLAILLGDYLHTLAFAALGAVEAPLADAFLKLQLEVVLGQSMDLTGSSMTVGDLDRARSLRHAWNVIEYKTARYTCEKPLLLGALAAGASRDDIAVLSSLGITMGVAYQLRDDVLGVVGDPVVTGKPVGADIIEGKNTVLYNAALARCHTPATRSVLRRYGAPRVTDADVRSIQVLFEDCGALQFVEDEITRRAVAAKQAIGGSTLSPQARDALVILVDAMAYRKA